MPLQIEQARKAYFLRWARTSLTCRRIMAFSSSDLLSTNELSTQTKGLTVMATGKQPRILATIPLGSAVYSTPVVANGVLYVSSNTHLFAFQANAKVVAGAAAPARLGSNAGN